MMKKKNMMMVMMMMNTTMMINMMMMIMNDDEGRGVPGGRGPGGPLEGGGWAAPWRERVLGSVSAQCLDRRP